MFYFFLIHHPQLKLYALPFHMFQCAGTVFRRQNLTSVDVISKSEPRTKRVKYVKMAVDP